MTKLAISIQSFKSINNLELAKLRRGLIQPLPPPERESIGKHHLREKVKTRNIIYENALCIQK